MYCKLEGLGKCIAASWQGLYCKTQVYRDSKAGNAGWLRKNFVLQYTGSYCKLQKAKLCRNTKLYCEIKARRWAGVLGRAGGRAQAHVLGSGGREC